MDRGITDIHQKLDMQPGGRIGALVAWFIGAALVGFGTWVFYAFLASPLFPDCGNPNDFLGGAYSGGAAADASLQTAIVLGILLCLGIGGVAVWLRRHLGILFATFMASYGIGLIVLWNVSPLIWGPRRCL